MADLEQIVLPHLEEYPIYAALFRNVKNAPFLREQLLQGNTAFEYAFVDASMVFSRAHLLAACFKAIVELHQHRLKTRNVHSEIVFALSPNNNIAESFRRFGLNEQTSDVIAVKVATSNDITRANVATHLLQHVDGDAESVSDLMLRDTRDLSKLRKIYKFDTNVQAAANAAERNEEYIKAVILGSMALKGS